MIYYLPITAALLFAAFVFLDTVSLFPRKAGANLEKNALGYSFFVMINTLKRIFIVLYPPVLGLLAIHSGIADFTKTILYSHILGALAVVSVYFIRNQIMDFFMEFIRLYSKENNLHKSALSSLKSVLCKNVKTGKVDIKISAVRKNIFAPAIFIFFFYSSAGFLINILATAFSDYSSFILQLIGIINAFGTIMMAFFLDPMISNTFEKGDPNNEVMPSLYFAQAINIAVISPVFLIAITMFLT